MAVERETEAFQLIGGQWPNHWKPRDAGTFDQEAFETWWPRVAQDLGHLDSRICEQWIHRHWSHSPYYGMDVRGMSSALRRMSTHSLLREVGTVDDRSPDPPPDPVSLYDDFNPSGEPLEPALSINKTGTWNIPVLLLENAGGFAYFTQLFTSVKLWLLEGHQRLRYLRALRSLGKQVAEEHDVLVLVPSAR